MSQVKRKGNQQQERPVSIMPNGFGIGLVDNDMVVIDFVGTMHADGSKEILGSYVLSVKRADEFATQIKEAIGNAATSSK